MTIINRPVTPQDRDMLKVEFARAVKILSHSDFFERMKKYEVDSRANMEEFLRTAIQSHFPGVISDYDYSTISLNLFGKDGEENTIGISEHDFFGFLLVELIEDKKAKIKTRNPFTFANILDKNGYQELNDFPNRFRTNYMKEFLANPTDAYRIIDHSELDVENFSTLFLSENGRLSQSFIDRYIETAITSGIGILENKSPQFLKQWQNDLSFVNAERLKEYFTAYLNQLELHPEKVADLSDVDALMNALLRLGMIEQIPKDLFTGIYDPIIRNDNFDADLSKMFSEFGALNI